MAAGTPGRRHRSRPNTAVGVILLRSCLSSLTLGLAFEASESPDGSWLYFSKPTGAIWKIPSGGGEEKPVLTSHTGRYWTLTRNGICFIDLSSTAHPTINLLDFTTGKIRNLATLDKPVDWGYSGLSVSADGKWIIYAQMDDLISQLMLVKNFH